MGCQANGPGRAGGGWPMAAAHPGAGLRSCAGLCGKRRAAAAWRLRSGGGAVGRGAAGGRMGTQGSPVKSYDYLLKFLLVGDSDVGKGEILESLQDGAAESPYAYSNGRPGLTVGARGGSGLARAAFARVAAVPSGPVPEICRKVGAGRGDGARLNGPCSRYRSMGRVLIALPLSKRSETPHPVRGENTSAA
ncbi:hypothetical protein U0070_005342, partial [Myodes glareolus]